MCCAGVSGRSGPRDNFISAELILHYLYGVIYLVIRHTD